MSEPVYEVAVVDGKDVIRQVRIVSFEDWVTDPARRTVKLPEGHDLRLRIGTLRWEWGAARFMPADIDPLEAAEQAAPGIVDVLAKMAQAMLDAGKLELPADEARALNAFLRAGGRRS